MTYPEDIMKAAREVAHGCVERPYNKGTLAKAEARIAAALLAERKAKVKVKPLVWVHRPYPMKTYCASDSRGDLYWINHSFGTDSYYFTTVRQRDGAILYDGDDLPSAKAAAQADFDADILSAIMGGSDE